ncbi:MAG: hypothetical protein WCP21_12000 [Armatimonadota bacterium]
MAALTEEEAELIRCFRRLSPKQKDQVAYIADELCQAQQAKSPEERLRHLRLAIGSWPRSKEETDALIADLHKQREIAEDDSGA